MFNLLYFTAGITRVFKIPYHKSQCATGAKFHGNPFYVHTHLACCIYMYVYSVLPRPFQLSSPPCLQQPYFFDVETKTINVVTNSAQTTPTRWAFNLAWEEPWYIYGTHDIIQYTCARKTLIFIRVYELHNGQLRSCSYIF